MTEQFTAADFERELADVAADYHPTARHIEVVLAALRIAQRVMTEENGALIKAVAEEMAAEHCHDSEPENFTSAARGIVRAIRDALTREEKA